MRAVLDTNIIVSGLIAPAGKPAAIIDAWLDGKFILPTCAAHIDGLRATLQEPRLAELVKPHKAGRLVNQVKKLSEGIDPLPRVGRSADPTNDFLLALSEAGKADHLVTGDKRGLLARGRFRRVGRMTSAEDNTTMLHDLIPPTGDPLSRHMSVCAHFCSHYATLHAGGFTL
jgi:putative PIN family toxin of toxin-antitoxin system